ncbi:hypothetical protein ACHAPJ_001200 [Fusarium lateritium]
MNWSNVSTAGTRSSSRARSPPPADRAAGGNDRVAFNNFQFSGKGSGPAPAPADDPMAREIHAEWQKGAQLKPRMKHDTPKGP